MLNNLNYIHGCLQEESIQAMLGERSEQLASFYRTEITEYLTKYLRSWNRVSSAFSSFDTNADKRAVKAVYSVNKCRILLKQRMKNIFRLLTKNSMQ